MNRGGFTIFALSMTLATILFVTWVVVKPGENRAESNAVTVLRDFAAGKPISRIAFANAFEDGAGGIDGRKIERAAELLHIKYMDLYDLVAQANQSVIYTGPADKIPAKLRPTTAPAEASYSSEQAYTSYAPASSYGSDYSATTAPTTAPATKP